MFVILFSVCVICAYLLGSISFSIIITFLVTKKDIRNLGSGNAGGTNALRVLGKKFGLLVMILDVLKSFLSVIISQNIFKFININITIPFLIIIGISCIMGHLFPVYYGFKGGKGIACTAGLILAINPLAFIILILIWAIIILITKYVSVASITIGVLLPISMFFFYFENNDKFYITLLFAVVGAILILTHRQNIKRLLNRTENRMGSKKK